MNKRILTLAIISILAFVVVAVPPFASAQRDVLIESDEAYHHQFFFGSPQFGGRALGFTSNVTYAYTPTSVTFFMGQTGNPPGTLVAEIYSVAGGLIAGSPMASSTPRASTEIPYSDAEVAFTFPNAPLLQANGLYAYAVHVSDTNVTPQGPYFSIVFSPSGSSVQLFDTSWTVNMNPNSQGIWHKLRGVPLGYVDPNDTTPPDNNNPPPDNTPPPDNNPPPNNDDQNTPPTYSDSDQIFGIPTRTFVIIVAGTGVLLGLSIIVIAMPAGKGKKKKY